MKKVMLTAAVVAALSVSGSAIGSSAPIVIAAGTNVATVTEATGFVGRAWDGITAVYGGDHVTGREHQASAIAIGVLGMVGGSMLARKNVAAGVPPFLKVIG